MKHLLSTALLGGILALVVSSCAPREALHPTSGPSTASASSAPIGPNGPDGPRYYIPNSGSSASAKQPGYAPGPSAPAAQTAGDTFEERWPSAIVSGSTTITLFEPQVDFWDGSHLVGRQAVAVQSTGEPQPNYGVVTLKAVTLVDKSSRTVTLENVEISGGDFASAKQRAPEFVLLLQEKVPGHFPKLALTRLESSFISTPSSVHASSTLNNAPPEVIVSTKPAMLVLVDGPPVFRPVPGTDLQRVINTHVLLLKGTHDQLYLHLWDGYMTASSLDGPWTVANTPPAGAATAEQEARNANPPLDLLQSDSQAGQTPAQPSQAPSQTPSLTNSAAPVIYARTAPAELISFQGEPNFIPIQNTHLLYAANTTANVFKLLTDQQTYVLISGRWFHSESLNGPWHYVPAYQLAADFKSIPDDSPKENVKASIPGTQQANESLIANSIPESSKVPRNTEMQNPQIDGDPKLQPIKGTSLQYVANSATPIVKVDDNSWYACQNGVWFASTSVKGPWVVANSVPQVIYTIPPDSPLHYLTYVQVYGSNSQYVYAGYTPGYLGTEVQDGVVVYGTGYYHPGWVGGVWYGYPATWGYGWGPCWNPWYNWSFYCGFGWGWGWGWYGCFPPYPCWGPYYGCHYYGRYYGYGHGGIVVHRTTGISTAHSVYSQNRPTASAMTATRSAPALNNGRYAQAYNSRTGHIAAGQRASVQSVYSPTSVNSGPQGRGMTTRPGGTSSGTWRGGTPAGPVGARGYSGSSANYYRGGYMGGSAGYYRGPATSSGRPGGYAPGMFGGHGGGYGGGFSGGRPGGGGAPSGGGHAGGGGGHGGGGGGGHPR